ncbi:MAG: hypothetical protein YK1309IOTA_1020006 [Marine Group I thaumarchaeote]|nr:MAG: hypothetical protein YK1309IOTA_1020006 [Marine Group I thaumarchaeote]
MTDSFASHLIENMTNLPLIKSVGGIPFTDGLPVNPEQVNP